MVYVASFFSENLAALQERSIKHQEMNFKTRTLVLLCVLFISYLMPGTISAANTPLPGPDPDPRLPLVIDLVQHEDAPFCDCNLTDCADACRTIANPGSVTCSYQKDVQFYVEARDLSTHDTYIFPVMITDDSSSRAQINVNIDYCNNSDWNLAEDTDWNSIPVLQVLHNGTVVGTIFFHTNLTMNMSVSQGFQLARMEACELECGDEEGSSELRGWDHSHAESTHGANDKNSGSSINRTPPRPLVIDLVQHAIEDLPWYGCELDSCDNHCVTPRPSGVASCSYELADTFHIEVQANSQSVSSESNIMFFPVVITPHQETGGVYVVIDFYDNNVWDLLDFEGWDNLPYVEIYYYGQHAGTVYFHAGGYLLLETENGYTLRSKTGCGFVCEEEEEHTLLQTTADGASNGLETEKGQANSFKNGHSLTVSPNPVFAQFQLRYPATLSGQSSMLSVYDLNGKMVYQQAVSHHTAGQLDIDSSEWPAGLYIIRLENEEQSLVSKLMKQ